MMSVVVHAVECPVTRVKKAALSPDSPLCFPRPFGHLSRMIQLLSQIDPDCPSVVGPAFLLDENQVNQALQRQLSVG